MNRLLCVLAVTVLLTLGSYLVLAQNAPQATPMSFFITSVGSGNGANLSGLAGADQHCQRLAQAVGAGDRAWRAYLSASASGNQPAVNARDRIGRGPWSNAKGARIAKTSMTCMPTATISPGKHSSPKRARTRRGTIF